MVRRSGRAAARASGGVVALSAGVRRTAAASSAFPSAASSPGRPCPSRHRRGRTIPAHRSRTPCPPAPHAAGASRVCQQASWAGRALLPPASDGIDGLRGRVIGVPVCVQCGERVGSSGGGGWQFRTGAPSVRPSFRSCTYMACEATARSRYQIARGSSSGSSLSAVGSEIESRYPGQAKKCDPADPAAGCCRDEPRQYGRQCRARGSAASVCARP